MRTVGAREANQRFSELLREVESGKEITVTRNGKPVARIMPAARKTPTGKAREKAIDDMVAAMRKGLNLGGRKFTRDEMHED
jgi:prevent-host-death family protein